MEFSQKHDLSMKTSSFLIILNESLFGSLGNPRFSGFIMPHLLQGIWDKKWNPGSVHCFKVMGTIASQLKALSENTPQSSIIL